METTSVENINLLDLYWQGGWYIMIPLTLLLASAIYLSIERFLAIRNATTGAESFMEHLEKYVKQKNFDGASNLCAQADTPYARMIEKGITKASHNIKDVSLTLENAGKIEIFELEDKLSALATISGVAPMIGFLGTTIGMITTFHQMSVGGVEIQQLSGGIMQAMVTTVAGLIVGIYAFIAYNTLVAKIAKAVYYLENISLEFVEALENPEK